MTTSRADEWIMRAANAWIRLTNRRLVRACRRHFGYVPDIARPRGHDALMQWRKVFDHNPLFTVFCDKLAARDWARQRLPELDTAEILWTGKRLADLPDGLLTDDCVLKVNTGSGSNYFPGRQRWTAGRIRRRFRRWMRKPNCGPGEWAYATVERRLLVERLIGPPDKVLDLIIRGQDGELSYAFLGINWKSRDARGCYLSLDGQPMDFVPAENARLARQLLRPDHFARATEIARQLSRGIDHVRVDFHICGDLMVLGEMTVYSSSGLGDEERDGVGVLTERAWIKAIDKSWFLSTPQPWPMSLYQGAFRRWVAHRRHELAIVPATEPAPAAPAP